MATEERNTDAPALTLVVDVTQQLEGQKTRAWNREHMWRAADEVLEDCCALLTLLEAFAVVKADLVIDPGVVQATADVVVEKIRRAQRCIRGEV